VTPDPGFKVMILIKGDYFKMAHGYYRTVIGNQRQTIEWYQFRWPWVTPDTDFMVAVFLKLTLKNKCQKWCQMEPQLLWPTASRLCSNEGVWCHCVYEPIVFMALLHSGMCPLPEIHSPHQWYNSNKPTLTSRGMKPVQGQVEQSPCGQDRSVCSRDAATRPDSSELYHPETRRLLIIHTGRRQTSRKISRVFPIHKLTFSIGHCNKKKLWYCPSRQWRGTTQSSHKVLQKKFL